MFLGSTSFYEPNCNWSLFLHSPMKLCFCLLHSPKKCPWLSSLWSTGCVIMSKFNQQLRVFHKMFLRNSFNPSCSSFSVNNETVSSVLASTAAIWLLHEDTDVWEKTQDQRVRQPFGILLKSKIRHKSVVTASPCSSLFIILSQGLQMAVLSVCLTWGHSSAQHKTGRTTVFVHSLYWKFFTCESSEPAQTQL